MDDTNGAIVVASLLDRENQREYELMVQATDNGLEPLSSNATVHIRVTDSNNRSPKFDRPNYSVNVGEDTGVNSVIGTVAATDSDLGVNAIIEYTITQGMIRFYK